jgi:hypothetical protein
MRFLDGEIVLAIGMLLALGLGVLAVITLEPENCKPTGETRSVTSFVLVGVVAVPYTFQQPVYECSGKKE